MSKTLVFGAVFTVMIAWCNRVDAEALDRIERALTTSDAQCVGKGRGR